MVRRSDRAQQQNIPQHVAIIMDGNGRWAQRRVLPRHFGHREGVAALKSAVRFCVRKNIKILTVYAFSTENWHRSPTEVGFLMELMRKVLHDELAELRQEGARIQMIGSRETLSPEIKELWQMAEDSTRANSRLLLNIAFNYGGRDELTWVARRAAELALTGQIALEQIDEDLINGLLFTAGCPDPDLVIRTGGETRLSNFLLWQAAYAEWVFLDTLWPDFGDEDFEMALAEFANRERRYGRVNSGKGE